MISIQFSIKIFCCNISLLRATSSSSPSSTTSSASSTVTTSALIKLLAPSIDECNYTYNQFSFWQHPSEFLYALTKNGSLFHDSVPLPLSLETTSTTTTTNIWRTSHQLNNHFPSYNTKAIQDLQCTTKSVKYVLQIHTNYLSNNIRWLSCMKSTTWPSWLLPATPFLRMQLKYFTSCMLYFYNKDKNI